MQNQWFGDKNDYLKYSVIRYLMVDGCLEVAVNWMWNPDNGQWDWSKRSYLKNPARYRKYDPEVFDYLVSVICKEGLHSVPAMATGGPIANALFYSAEVPVKAMERAAWFADFLKAATDCAIVFFDPDTGIVRTSTDSSRCNEFVLWDELEQTFTAGHSLLIYQHRARDLLPEVSARGRSLEVKERLKVDNVSAIFNGSVALLIVPQSAHAVSIQRTAAQIASSWAGEANLIRV